jgi:hypothetical protein
MTRCDGCQRLTSESDLEQVVVQVCHQTMSSPAEYEPMLLCDICRDPDFEERVAYERANWIYKERTGSEL